MRLKTRYKIIAVIGIFVIFYMQLPWMLDKCRESQGGCTILRELMQMTRLSVFTGEDIWREGGTWSGTVDGIETEHSIGDYLRINQSFIATMIAAPSAIIAVIILWDKRR